MNPYKIINNRGHFEAYRNGKFICSGDSEKEILDELEFIDGSQLN